MINYVFIPFRHVELNLAEKKKNAITVKRSSEISVPLTNAEWLVALGCFKAQVCDSLTQTIKSWLSSESVVNINYFQKACLL